VGSLAFRGTPRRPLRTARLVESLGVRLPGLEELLRCSCVASVAEFDLALGREPIGHRVLSLRSGLSIPQILNALEWRRGPPAPWWIRSPSEPAAAGGPPRPVWCGAGSAPWGWGDHALRRSASRLCVMRSAWHDPRIDGAGQIRRTSSSSAKASGDQQRHERFRRARRAPADRQYIGCGQRLPSRRAPQGGE
jgi:hypothetical protein